MPLSSRPLVSPRNYFVPFQISGAFFFILMFGTISTAVSISSSIIPTPKIGCVVNIEDHKLAVYLKNIAEENQEFE